MGHKELVKGTIPEDFREHYLGPNFIASTMNYSKQTKLILSRIENVILEVYRSWGIMLSYENVWQFMKLIDGDPDGPLQDSLFYYLGMFDIPDIEAAITDLPMYNQS